MTSLSLSSAFTATALLPPPTLPGSPELASEVLRLYEFYRYRPQNDDLCTKLGELVEGTGNADQALPWFKEAVRLKPSAENLRRLADRYTWQNRLKEASALIGKLRRLEPDNPEWVKKQTELGESSDSGVSASSLPVGTQTKISREEELGISADRHLAANQPLKALRVLKELLKIRPRDADVWLKYADTAEWTKNLPLAIQALKQANRLRPSRALRRKIFERLIWSGQTAEAEKVIQVFLPTIQRDPPLYAMYGEMLDGKGLATATREIFDRLPRSELTPIRRLRRAQLRRDAGNLAGAKKDLGTIMKPSIARRLDGSTRFQSQFLAGEINLQEKRYSDALRGFIAARSLLEGDKPVVITTADRISLTRRIAEAARLAGNKVEEEVALRSLARVEEKPAPLLTDLSRLARERGDFTTAQTFLERALASQPQDSDLQREMAEMLLENHASAAARPWLQSLVASFPDDLHLRDTLVSVMEQQRDWEALLPFRWEAYLATPSRETLLMLVPTLLAGGHGQKAAELALPWLVRDPFDAELETIFQKAAASYPAILAVWPRLKPASIEKVYLGLISSYSLRLARDPSDTEARKKRAEVYLWRQMPKQALKDYRVLVASQPDDQDLLKTSVEIAEWSGDLPQTISLRKNLHQAAPEEASNTLMLARHLGWNQRQNEALKYYREILASSASVPDDVRLTAIPVFQWSGHYSEARKHWEAIQPPAFSGTPARVAGWKKEVERLRKSLKQDTGPTVRIRQGSRRDTEQVSDSRLQLFARHHVGDGTRQESRLEDISMTQNKYNHRSFKGRWLRHSFFRPRDNGRELQFGFSLLENRSDSKTNLFLPIIGQVIRSHGRETTWNFEEEPVFDTPEALRQNLTLRRLHLTHVRPLSNRSSISWWARAGSFSDGNSLFMGGFSVERLTRLDPNQGWRYQYSRHHTNGNGGNIYYTPKSLGTHQLVWFGEREFKWIPGNSTHLGWEAFIGQEEGRASFNGVRAVLRRQLSRDWNLRAEGGVLKSSQSHFGGGNGAYEQWDWNVQLEKTWW